MSGAGQAPRVLVALASDSDLPVMSACLEMLKRFGVAHEVRICSAHRSPRAAQDLAAGARGRGIGVIIAAASGAAHLAGLMAAHSTLPVIGVPLAAPPIGGLDALYATVQMPPGVPVATVSVGDWGARNAAILAAQVLSLADPEIAERLERYKEDLAGQVARKDWSLHGGAS